MEFHVGVTGYIGKVDVRSKVEVEKTRQSILRRDVAPRLACTYMQDPATNARRCVTSHTGRLLLRPSQKLEEMKGS